MKTPSRPKIKFYPKDIQRFVIISLGLAGYFLILSVINDYALVRITSSLKNSELWFSVIETMFIVLLLLPLYGIVSSSEIREHFDWRLLLIQLSSKIELLIGTFLIAYNFPEEKMFIIPIIYISFYILGRIFNIKRILRIRSRDLTSIRLLAIGASAFVSDLAGLLLIAYLFATQELFSAFLGALLLQLYVTYVKKVHLRTRYSLVIRFILWSLIIYLYYIHYLG